jgi:hypothetical protein
MTRLGRRRIVTARKGGLYDALSINQLRTGIDPPFAPPASGLRTTRRLDALPQPSGVFDSGQRSSPALDRAGMCPAGRLPRKPPTRHVRASQGCGRGGCSVPEVDSAGDRENRPRSRVRRVGRAVADTGAGKRDVSQLGVCGITLSPDDVPATELPALHDRRSQRRSVPRPLAILTNRRRHPHRDQPLVPPSPRYGGSRHRDMRFGRWSRRRRG